MVNKLKQHTRTKDQYYHLTFGRFKFEAEVSYDDEYNILEILIGGSRRKCVRIIVNEAKTEADILTVEFDSRCCVLPRELSRKDGTVAMMGAAAMFLTDKFPHLQVVRYTDSSYFDCSYNGAHAGKVKLAGHHMLLYGMTWYERVFSSDFVKPSDSSAEKVRRIRRVGKANLAGRPFAELRSFLRRHGPESMDAEEWLKHNMRNLELAYEGSATLAEFAQKVQHMRDDGSCTFFLGYMPRLYQFAGKDYSDSMFTSWVTTDPKGCAERVRSSWGMTYTCTEASSSDSMRSLNTVKESFANASKMIRARRPEIARPTGSIGSASDPEFVKFNLMPWKGGVPPFKRT